MPQTRYPPGKQPPYNKHVSSFSNEPELPQLIHKSLKYPLGKRPPHDELELPRLKFSNFKVILKNV